MAILGFILFLFPFLYSIYHKPKNIPEGEKMDKLIDLHCDTIWRLMEAGKNATLENNPFCVNLKEMRRADTMAQFFACFVDMQWFQEENKFEEGY